LFGDFIQTRILKYVVWKRKKYDLDFLKSLHKRRDVKCRKFLSIKIRNVCKIACFKIIGLPITIDMHAIQEKSKGDYRFVSHDNKGTYKQWNLTMQA